MELEKVTFERFLDDDYIVFSFKEDGSYDVIKDPKLQLYDHFDSAISRPSPFTNRTEQEESMEPYKKRKAASQSRRRRTKEATESSDLDCSRRSFSFPVLQWERIESPEKMPKPGSEEQIREQGSSERMQTPEPARVTSEDEEKTQKHRAHFRCFSFRF